MRNQPAGDDSGSIEGNFELAPVQSGALEAITRGEIDIQIATAHKYPRNITVFKEKALAMATNDVETAESCIYVRPVGKEKDPKTGKWEQKFAEGLSIRMAEIVAASYKNLRVGAMVIEQTPERVVCRGFAHDLEMNYAASSEKVEVTLKQDGTPYSARQAALVAQACISKALRDAIFRVVPRAMIKSIEIECRKLIAGTGKSFDQRRDAVVQWAQRLGIDVNRVWNALKIEGPEDLTGDHLLTLTGLRTAIRDNEVNVDEAFPVLPKTGNVGTTTAPAGTTATEDAAAGAAAKPGTTAAPETPKPDQKPAGEAPKPEETPKSPPAPKAPKGPTANELRKILLGKIGAQNIGKSRLMQELKAMSMVPADAEWDKLDAATLAHIDDGIEEIIEKILNPNPLG